MGLVTSLTAQSSTNVFSLSFLWLHLLDTCFKYFVFSFCNFVAVILYPFQTREMIVTNSVYLNLEKKSFAEIIPSLVLDDNDSITNGLSSSLR